VQNILQKLEMHSKLEAATFAMQHDLPSRRISGDPARMNRRQRSRPRPPAPVEEDTGAAPDIVPKDPPPTAS
jgi:hypothetical protein